MHNIIVIVFLIFSCIFSYNLYVEPINKSVILLHGLGDVKLSMLKLERALKDEGYAIKQTVLFLKTGKFKHRNDD